MQLEAEPPVAQGQEGRAFNRAQEEVGEAVLVQVGRGGAQKGSARGETGLRRHVRERAVAQVLEQEGRAVVAKHQEIDVAAVVEVGGDDRDRMARGPDPRLRGDVGEGAVAVVLEQEAGGGREVGGEREGAAGVRGGREVGQAGHEHVEVAVVVDVHEGGGEGDVGIGGQLGRRRHVPEPPPAFVVEEGQGSRLQDEEVGAAVVVIVPRHHGPSLEAEEARGAGHVREPALVVPEHAQDASLDVDGVQRAVPVQVHEGDRGPAPGAEGGGHLARLEGAAEQGRPRGGRGGRGKHTGRLAERDRGRLRVDQVGLGAGRGQGLGVAALFEVGLPEARLVAAVAQLLEARHLGRPRLALAPARQRDPEVVGRAHVVGLGLRGQPEGRHRLLELPLLEIDLSEDEVRPQVPGVGREHVLQARDRVVSPVLHPRDERE